MELNTKYRILRDRYTYDPESGNFYYKLRPGWIGKIAGTTNKQGYILIGIGKIPNYAHRMAWLYMTGKLPEETIDHINCNPSDNRWLNLREASYSENMRNRRIGKSNKTGYKGIHKNPVNNKYRVMIYIGSYDTIEEAIEIYEKACKLYHGEFARTK